MAETVKDILGSKDATPSKDTGSKSRVHELLDLDDVEVVNPTDSTTYNADTDLDSEPKDLTPEQDTKLVDYWNSRKDNPPSLKDCTIEIWGKPLDGRTWQAQAIKKALGKKGLKAKTLVYNPDDKFQLEDVHKQYVDNHLTTMNPLEMAKELFQNPTLTNLHGEVRAIASYIKSLNNRLVYSQHDIDNVPKGKYEPPKNFQEAWERINRYVSFCPDKTKMTTGQRRMIDMLMTYLHTFRYITQINTYDTETDRRIAEDAFVRATHDKPDLMQEEIDQYIEYANHVVQGFIVQRRSNKLQNALETISGNDPETMKISMGLVEAIGKASTEYHNIKKREQDLLDDLKQKRSVRMSKQVKDNATVLNLVQEWKNEETRQEWIAQAEKEQKGIGAEVEKLTKLPDMVARVMGLTREEILNG